MGVQIVLLNTFVDLFFTFRNVNEIHIAFLLEAVNFFSQKFYGELKFLGIRVPVFVLLNLLEIGKVQLRDSKFNSFLLLTSVSEILSLGDSKLACTSFFYQLPLLQILDASNKFTAKWCRRDVARFKIQRRFFLSILCLD